MVRISEDTKVLGPEIVLLEVVPDGIQAWAGSHTHLCNLATSTVALLPGPDVHWEKVGP